MEETSQELRYLLEETKLLDVPLLVFANKKDLSAAFFKKRGDLKGSIK
jgi:hypothetical protein